MLCIVHVLCRVGSFSERRVTAIGARLRKCFRDGADADAGAAHEHTAAVAGADARGKGVSAAFAIASKIARVRTDSGPTCGLVAH